MKEHQQSIAVIGGGITGCVAALSLADLGHRVCLFERGRSVMGGASLVNEGKIHLGFVYVNDPSLRSLDVMVESAVVFRSILERWIKPDDFDALVSKSFEYIVPNDTQVSPEEISSKFKLIEEKIRAAEQRHGTSYLGMPREEIWSRSSMVPDTFNSEEIKAHYHTLERSVDTQGIAALLSQSVEAHNNIELHLERSIVKIYQEKNSWVLDGVKEETVESFRPFDFVINAAWDGRPPLDAQVFGPDKGKWFHRYKSALNLIPPSVENLPNFTAIIGAYGDMIAYPSGRVYLSYYPVGMLSSSRNIEGVETRYSDARKYDVAVNTLSGLSRFVPSIERVFASCEIKAEQVVGGIIMARGVSDINDSNSELHQRHRIGIQKKEGYLSIDTGKYTCGPALAEQAVKMIME